MKKFFDGSLGGLPDTWWKWLFRRTRRRRLSADEGHLEEMDKAIRQFDTSQEYFDDEKTSLDNNPKNHSR